MNTKQPIISRFTKIFILATLGPLLLLIVYASLFHSKSEGGQTMAEWEAGRRDAKARMNDMLPDPISAWVMAKEFVKPKLKAPSTAKFPQYNPKKIHHIGEGRYKIASYVDSQNSFGATLRTSFSCVIRYEGNDKWVLEWLDI